MQTLSWITTKAFAYLAKGNEQKTLALVQKSFFPVVLLSVAMVSIWPDSDGTIPMISTVVGKFAFVAFLFGGGAGIFGAAFLLLVVAMSVASVGFGVVPSKELEMGKFVRWMTAAFSFLVVEVHAEATPPGSWTVDVLEREGATGAASNATLVHSVYDDPRAHKALVHWLETSSHALKPSRECYNSSENEHSARST